MQDNGPVSGNIPVPPPFPDSLPKQKAPEGPKEVDSEGIESEEHTECPCHLPGPEPPKRHANAPTMLDELANFQRDKLRKTQVLSYQKQMEANNPLARALRNVRLHMESDAESEAEDDTTFD